MIVPLVTVSEVVKASKVDTPREDRNSGPCPYPQDGGGRRESGETEGKLDFWPARDPGEGNLAARVEWGRHWADVKCEIANFLVQHMFRNVEEYNLSQVSKSNLHIIKIQ